MVGNRKSSFVKDQVFGLYRRNTAKKKIAEILGISKNTVKGVIRASEIQALNI